MRLVYQYLINAALILVLLTGVDNLQAQDGYGDKWVLGWYPVLADATRGDLPNTFIDDTHRIDRANACISDKNGNLKFYTNGLQVFNAEHQVMKNGDSLGFDTNNPNWYAFPDGIPSAQNVIIIPLPGNSYKYFIFHTYPLDTSAGSTVPNRLLLSIVDMQGDSGRGEVISKNEAILNHVPLSSERLSACKHANGRDWWLIKAGIYTNTYYKFLITDKGWSGPYTQDIGIRQLYNYGGQSVFSPDGKKYASIGGSSKAIIMDFNRCTGEFSRPIIVSNLYDNSTLSGGHGIAFSPSGRFLYIHTDGAINQYDSENNYTDSIRIFTTPSQTVLDVNFDISQLAPNGKIYFACYSSCGVPALSVIHSPDSLGSFCKFVRYGQPINTLDNSPPLTIPNMPNYRLGKLVGSPCDTLVSDIKYTEALSTGISVYPNPAANTINISIAENQPGLKLFVTDINGSIVHSQAIYSETAVDISKWAAGFYFVRIESNSKLMAMRKFVKE
ncbi:MAG: T9SS type A sorting domain-containing protein [Chitinophagales bacterium]|nr:T9SS type A sorting domain-containing protein [Chitinophagales bacterium]